MKSLQCVSGVQILLIITILMAAATISNIYAQAPNLAVEPGELSFGEVAMGETAVLNYTLSGSNLLSNVYIHTTMGYLISLDEETGYQQNLLIQPVDGEVSTTIYVKFVPLFPRGYDGRVRHRTVGHPDCFVMLEGFGIIEGEDMPALQLDPGSLYFGEVQVGDEAIQSYTLTGSNLLSNVMVNACQGYLISLEESGGFVPQLVIEPVDGEVSQEIFVKFLPFFPREFNGRIRHRAMGVMGEFLYLYGTGVLDAEFMPNLTVNPDSLYFGEVVIGEEALLSYVLTGENLLSNVRIRAPRGYLLSLEENGEFLPFLVLEPVEGALSATIYVKFLPLYERVYFGAVRNMTMGIMGTPVKVHGIGILEDPRINPLLEAEEQVARGVKLLGNYPNPFNPETRISFTLEEAGFVTVEVYNSRGQKVKTLVNDYLSSGTHSILWNGRDTANREVSSGIYFYRMHKGSFTSTKKMIMMK